MIELGRGVVLTAPANPHAPEVLTRDALAFVTSLHRSFNRQRERLLADRAERQLRIDSGETPEFLPETADLRNDSDWQVVPAPSDLNDRRVEITGPAEPKMMVNGLNSGARVFMADFEDALSPTWDNLVTGQWAVREAVRQQLTIQTDARTYTLNPSIATLVIRPRGWHLTDPRLQIDGQPVSASLLDFGLFLFHNGRELLNRGSGPYLYLPKLESRLEARLWNDVFVAAQAALDIPRGTIRATVLIETILAAFEMDEILWELREHAAGLNAGRWDYIFSLIKKLRTRPEVIMPDRAQVTMAVPFMRAYQQLLVQTCHRRGAHAIGGMSAFIPNRREPEVTARAIEQVRVDKLREAGDGSDGSWVAHPDLVPVVTEIFDAVLGARPHQKDRYPDAVIQADDLLTTAVLGGRVTEAGVRTNVEVALHYLAAWLGGNGAVAIHDLMEDAATAEISRAQLWQWRTHAAPLSDGRHVTADLYCQVRDQVLIDLTARVPNLRWADATDLLDQLVLADTFAEFLTIPAASQLQA